MLMQPSLPPAGPAHDADPAHATYFFVEHFFGHVFKRIFHDFWLPSGGPKSAQTRLFPEKATPRSDLFVTFVATAIVLAFFVDFWSKLQEKQ